MKAQTLETYCPGKRFSSYFLCEQPISVYRKYGRWAKKDWFAEEKTARTFLTLRTRVIRFMDATSLRPSTASTVLFGQVGTPLCFDHTMVWIWFGVYVVTTEPYKTALSAGDPKEWAAQRGWSCVQAPHLGMWNPLDTTLYLMSPPRRGTSDLNPILDCARHYCRRYGDVSREVDITEENF